MIDDKMAKMAINTLKEYCKNLCSRCAVYGSCGQRYCYFENVDGYNDVGTFEDLQKSTGKPPKFDIRQKDSAAFRNYINKIFMEEAEKYGLPMNTANSIKWTARGTIVVTFVDDDNKTNYIGVAKCHPDDAFNPEIGIKLAIERTAQAMHAPFIPKENEAYYYVDDENRVYSTINRNTNRDILNIAIGNCFRTYNLARANTGVIMKRKVVLKSLREDDANAMGRCK